MTFNLNNNSVRRLALFGGGRWARTLLSVLRTKLPGEVEIVWVTQHLQHAAQAWLEDRRFENVVLCSDVPMTRDAIDGVIIATSPIQHHELLQRAIANNVPVLCEKPLSTSAAEFKELERSRRSIRTGQVCGVHLEFLLAEFLHQFRDLITNITVESVDVFWQDPWTEQRSGETKHSEMYVDIMRDQLPHCWSVLTIVVPTIGPLQIRSLDPKQQGWILELTDGAKSVTFHQSRRALNRVRAIIINQGEAQLDFSSEPGSAIINGERIAMPECSRRPLGHSLNSFVSTISGKQDAQKWPLAIENVWPALELAELTAAELLAAQKHEARRLWLHDDFDVNNPDHVALVVDTLFPVIAASQRREPLITTRQQQDFAMQHWRSLADL